MDSTRSFVPIRIDTLIGKEGQVIYLYRRGQESLEGKLQLNEMGLPCVKKNKTCYEIKVGHRVGIKYKTDNFRIYDVI